MFGPSFVKIGTQSLSSQGTYNMCDLTPTAIDDPATSRTGKVPDGKAGTAKSISMQKLTASGGPDGDVLFWFDYESTGPMGKTTYKGWYNNKKKKQTELTLQAGESVWMSMPSDACCTFTVNGEVVAGDIFAPLNLGNTALCNPQAAALTTDFENGGIYPFAADPADIPDGKSGTAKSISLQKLTASGGPDGDVLFWFNYESTGPMGKTVYHGWYNNKKKIQKTVSIAPGEGLWVANPINNKCSLCFPTVLPAAE